MEEGLTEKPIGERFACTSHPRKGPMTPMSDYQDERDWELFSRLGKISQSGSRKYSLKVVAGQRQ
jgi:hypothetical protein